VALQEQIGGRTATAGWCEAIALGDLLLRTADADPDATALVMPDASWTYGDMAAAARHVARGLIGLGLRPGTHVGVLVPNGFECLVATFGVALAGCAVVPVNGRFQPREVGYVIRHADLAAIVTSDLVDDHVDFSARITEAVPGLADASDPANLSLSDAPALRCAAMLGTKRPAGFLDQAGFDAVAAGIPEAEVDRRRARVGLRTPAMVLYTSGTTADPRGCLISHEALTRDWAAVGRALRLTSEDRLWNPCPMFHIAAIGASLAAVANGATILTNRWFDPEQAVALLERERPTALYPAYAQVMLDVLNHPRAADLDLRAVSRLLAVGPAKTLYGLQERMPHATLMSTFGMTESCGCSTAHDPDDPPEVRCETVGRALPGLEARIVDPETEREAPFGTPGEIRLRGPLLFDGYYGDEARTSASFDDAGWFRTGDLGTMDSAGRLAFRARIKDLLKVGGENVSPAEVEAHLMTHPAVHMAQLVGVPDDRLGEVPAAFVELKPGASATADELIAHCRGALARFKAPRHVRFVDEWPMSATKVQKFRLRERLLAELGIDDRA
jgi:fatty-acyl-CoA synthase